MHLGKKFEEGTRKSVHEIIRLGHATMVISTFVSYLPIGIDIWKNK